MEKQTFNNPNSAENYIRPHGYLTLPGGSGNNFSLRIMSHRHYEYQSITVTDQGISGGEVRVIDAIFNTRIGAPLLIPELFEHDMTVTRGQSETLLQINLYEMNGVTGRLGTCEIDFSDADVIPLNDFAPCCYLTRPDTTTNDYRFQVGVKILTGYTSSNILNNGKNGNVWNLRLNLTSDNTAVTSSGIFEPIQLVLSSELTDEVELTVFEDRTHKGKTKIRQIHSDNKPFFPPKT